MTPSHNDSDQIGSATLACWQWLPVLYVRKAIGTFGPGQWPEAMACASRDDTDLNALAAFSLRFPALSSWHKFQVLRGFGVSVNSIFDMQPVWNAAAALEYSP